MSAVSDRHNPQSGSTSLRQSRTKIFRDAVFFPLTPCKHSLRVMSVNSVRLRSVRRLRSLKFSVARYISSGSALTRVNTVSARASGTAQGIMERESERFKAAQPDRTSGHTHNHTHCVDLQAISYLLLSL